MMGLNKVTGLPMLEGLTTAEDMPHTLSYGFMYRAKIDSFQELPKDKRPPRNLWDKSFKLEEWFDEVFNRDRDEKEETKYVQYNEWEVE